MKGIPTWRFRASRDLLDYDTNKNLCFCPGLKKCLQKGVNDQWDKTNCTEDDICLNGLVHAKGCYVARLILSQPHFFLCDEKLINAIDGMYPDEDKHDTFLDGNLSDWVWLSGNEVYSYCLIILL